METKAQIRERIINIRNKMSNEEVEQKSSQIVQQVIKTPEYEEADNLLLYADYKKEVMTRKLFEHALLHKKKIYFPKCLDENNMEFYQVTSINQLFEGYKGIFEPSENEANKYKVDLTQDTLAIIPGVAFDLNGYRIGYGKGFYDKYLWNKRQMTYMALAFSNQIVDEIPNNEFDIRMDKIVTEEMIFSFLRV